MNMIKGLADMTSKAIIRSVNKSIDEGKHSDWKFNLMLAGITIIFIGFLVFIIALDVHFDHIIAGE